METNITVDDSRSSHFTSTEEKEEDEIVNDNVIQTPPIVSKKNTNPNSNEANNPTQKKNVNENSKEATNPTQNNHSNINTDDSNEASNLSQNNDSNINNQDSTDASNVTQNNFSYTTNDDSDFSNEQSDEAIISHLQPWESLKDPSRYKNSKKKTNIIHKMSQDVQAPRTLNYKNFYNGKRDQKK